MVISSKIKADLFIGTIYTIEGVFDMKKIFTMVLIMGFLFLNIDRYGNWCKGNLATKENAAFVIKNMVNTAPNDIAEMKLLKKLSQINEGLY